MISPIQSKGVTEVDYALGSMVISSNLGKGNILQTILKNPLGMGELTPLDRIEVL